MSTKSDELKFAEAYGEDKVKFSSFGRSTQKQEVLNNSSFALIRQIAEYQDGGTTLLGHGGAQAIRDHSSVMNLIRGKKEPSPAASSFTPRTAVSLVHAAKPLRNRSSLQSFLQQGGVDLEEPPETALKARPQERHIDAVVAAAEIVAESAPEVRKSVPEMETSAKKASVPVAKAASANRFSNLFKSAGHVYSRMRRTEDSLPIIYMRLLKCR